MIFEAIDQSALLMAANPEPLLPRADADLLDVPKQEETAEIFGAGASEEIDLPSDLAGSDPQIDEAPEGDLDFTMDPLHSDSGNFIDANGNGEYDEGETILSTSTRLLTKTGFNTSTGTGGGGGMTGGSGGTPPPPSDVFEQCRETSTMTPEQLEDYLVAVEAAEIAREIAQQPDRDTVEYGAVIYRDANGVITHTPLSRGIPSMMLSESWNLSGLPGWGSALGILHSHHASTFNTSYPLGRVYPTPYGDWAAFNNIQEMMVRDLTTNYGFSAVATQARANEFVQFIYGATGASGTGRYDLYRCDDGDEAYRLTGDIQVDHAEQVSIKLGTCGG